MRPEELSDAIGDLSEKYIESADKLRRRGKADLTLLRRGAALAACLCLAVGLGVWALGGPGKGIMGGSTGETCTADMEMGAGQSASGSAAVTESTAAGAPQESYDTAAAVTDSVTEESAPESEEGGSPYALTAVRYPETAPFPRHEEYTNLWGELDMEGYSQAEQEWHNERNARRALAQSYGGSLYGFYTATVPQILVGSDSENRVYSPINVYLALGMLAESTEGTSRQQILSLMGAENVEGVRAVAADIWNANYWNDGDSSSLLAGSVWLDEGMEYDSATLDILARHYYASAFRGPMGSEGYNAALRAWLNEQTGGLLEEQAADITLDPDSVLALATTVYYNARWSQGFPVSRTAEGIFHSPAGDMTCDFMHQSGPNTYYWGESFGAVSKGFESGGGTMWLILPDEGVSVNELAADEEMLRLVTGGGEWENSRLVTVNLAMPKFDVVSDLDLADHLRTLGITDVFDPAAADFSPIMADDDMPMWLSRADHAARVTVDEEGVEAAAYTVLSRDTGAMLPTDELDFVLDRPFIFAITGIDGEILFIGVVNIPC